MAIHPIWADAIAGYLNNQVAGGIRPATVTTRRQHLQHLARRIRRGPWELTGTELVTWCSRFKWSPSTRRSRRTTFQSFYLWAITEQLCSSSPAASLRKVRPIRATPRPAPLRVYLEARLRADELERTWLELAYNYGLRRAELAAVHRRDVIGDLVGHSLIVHGKGGVERVLPLAPSMAAVLLELDGWLCAGGDDGHVSPWWLGKRVNRLLVEPWTVHTLRHAAGTRFNQHGGLLVAQRLLGHASVATTQVYCAVPDESLRATVLATAS